MSSLPPPVPPRVVVDGDPVTTPVQVGTVGGTWLEVTSGVQAGQEVVLADLGAALPGSAIDGSAATTANGAGALPGGVFFPGGFGGGGGARPTGAFPGGGGPPVG